jgi:hypothetical protein
MDAETKALLDQYRQDVKKVDFDGSPDRLRVYLKELELLRKDYSTLIAAGRLHEDAIVRTTISGRARDWFVATHIWVDFSSFTTELKDRFGPRDDVQRAALRSMVYQDSMDVTEYCEQYTALLGDLGYSLDGKRALDDFLTSIASQSVRTYLRLQRPRNFLEAVKVLKEHDKDKYGSVSQLSMFAFGKPEPAGVPASAAATSAPSSSTAAPLADQTEEVMQLLKSLTLKVTSLEEQQQQQHRDEYYGPTGGPRGQPGWRYQQSYRQQWQPPPPAPNLYHSAPCVQQAGAGNPWSTTLTVRDPLPHASQGKVLPAYRSHIALDEEGDGVDLAAYSPTTTWVPDYEPHTPGTFGRTVRFQDEDHQSVGITLPLQQGGRETIVAVTDTPAPHSYVAPAPA